METMNDRLLRQRREFDAFQREQRRENNALKVLRYETNPKILREKKYPRRADLPYNAMFQVPARTSGSKSSWVNIHIPHGFPRVFRGTGPIPSEFLDKDGNLHPLLELWTGSSGVAGEVTYEDLLEASQSARKNVYIPSYFRPADEEEGMSNCLPAMYLDLQICVSVVGGEGAGLDSGDDAPVEPRSSAPSFFTSDMTTKNKMEAMAGALHLIAPAVLKQQIDKNSPAVVAKRQKIIDDKEKVCVVFVLIMEWAPSRRVDV